MIRKSSAALVLAGAVASGALAGCGSAAEPEAQAPASLTPVGDDLSQVTLTDEAVDRIAIATEPLVEEGGTKQIPYAAVVYHTDGSTWTYVEKEKHSYLREPITVKAIEGDTAVLDEGPEVGADVVVVGAPELLGAEYEISGEE